MDGNLLKVISKSKSDIGTQALIMNVTTLTKSGNFTVKVIFKDEV
jgi:hypothetical protein